jgi:hypothetical protein
MVLSKEARILAAAACREQADLLRKEANSLGLFFVEETPQHIRDYHANQLRQASRLDHAASEIQRDLWLNNPREIIVSVHDTKSGEIREQAWTRNMLTNVSRALKKGRGTKSIPIFD